MTFALLFVGLLAAGNGSRLLAAGSGSGAVIDKHGAYLGHKGEPLVECSLGSSLVIIVVVIIIVVVVIVVVGDWG